MDGETRGVARRLADGLETQQRQMDELDRKLGANKAALWMDCSWIYGLMEEILSLMVGWISCEISQKLDEL